MKVVDNYYQGLTYSDGIYFYDREVFVDYEAVNKKHLGVTEKLLLEVYRQTASADKTIATVDQLHEHGEKVFKQNYVDKIEPNTVHIFTLTNWQMRGFMNRMKRINLDKYIVHTSAPAANRNYPNRDPLLCLYVVIIHYKDYVK